MQMTFRWYNRDDTIPLSYIAQIPYVQGIVSAVYDVPVGEVWDEARIFALKSEIEAAGLAFEVVESVPVHEDIKRGAPPRDRLIENYCKTIENLGRAGVKVVCYNFMPVFDWLRSDLAHRLPDGSTCLAYSAEQLARFDPAKGGLSLPGWDESYTPDGLRALLDAYSGVDEEQLWENLIYFLRGIMPACERAGVKMAIHPDDPPWGMFGLPRIITGQAALTRLIDAVDSPCNSVTLCLGSLGSGADNDLAAITRMLVQRDKVAFVHARNVKLTGPDSFTETAHKSACGRVDMVEIFRILHEGGFDGYVRPDHGRNIWGEDGRPGYGLYDRALGAAYLSGIIETIERG